MSIATQIHTKITQALAPEVLEVTNESNRHAVAPGSESHFKLVIVTAQFANLNRIQRHRKVNALLAEELQQHIHALSLKLYTPSEWDAREGEVTQSPLCRGGSKLS